MQRAGGRRWPSFFAPDLVATECEEDGYLSVDSTARLWAAAARGNPARTWRASARCCDVRVRCGQIVPHPSSPTSGARPR